MGSKPEWAEQIARERIEILFEEAGEAFETGSEKTDRYVEIARDIAMKFNLSIPREYRRKFCSSCYSYIRPGANARVRVEDGIKKVVCGECGHVERFSYSDQGEDEEDSEPEQ